MSEVRVLEFPGSEQDSRVPRQREGRLPWKYRLRRFVAWLLHRFGCPGFVRVIEYQDPLTQDTFAVRCGPRFTRITVRGRDYYFDRLTGEFDGTGYTPCG